MTVVNVLICTTIAISMLMVFIELGYYKWFALIIALFIGVGTHGWLIFNHKIRHYIKEISHESYSKEVR